VVTSAGAPKGKTGTLATIKLPKCSPAEKEIKIGMTPLDVINVLGKPASEVAFENKTRWTYPDLTVIFENGRVKEVKF